MMGVSHHQDGVAAFVGGTGQVNRAFRVEERGACFFHEGAARIGEVDDPAWAV